MKIKEMLEVIKNNKIEDLIKKYKIVAISDKIGIIPTNENNKYVFVEYLQNKSKRYDGIKEVYFTVDNGKNRINKIVSVSKENIREINL